VAIDLAFVFKGLTVDASQRGDQGVIPCEHLNRGISLGHGCFYVLVPYLGAGGLVCGLLVPFAREWVATAKAGLSDANSLLRPES